MEAMTFTEVKKVQKGQKMRNRGHMGEHPFRKVAIITKTKIKRKVGTSKLESGFRKKSTRMLWRICPKCKKINRKNLFVGSITPSNVVAINPANIAIQTASRNCVRSNNFW